MGTVQEKPPCNGSQATVESKETKLLTPWRKKGASQHQLKNYVTHKEKVHETNHTTTLLGEKTIHINKNDAIHTLYISEQISIFTLCIGHNHIKHHMHRILKIGDGICECVQEPETPEHLMQRCPRFLATKSAIWPKAHQYQISCMQTGGAQNDCVSAFMLE